MSDQQFQSGRKVRVAAPATPSGSTAPHITLSPVTPWGTETDGFRFAFKAPTLSTAAVASPGDFTVTIYVRDGGAGEWYALKVQTGILLGALYGTFDLSGPLDLFFAVSNVATPGDLFVSVLEQ